MSNGMSVDGLGSGLSTSDIISKLMQIARQPQVLLQNQKTALQAKVTAYQSLNSKMQALGTAAADLDDAKGWSVWKANSSDITRVTATATADAVGGSLAFTINKLASASSLVSSGSVSATTATIAAGNSVLLAKGGSTVGVSTVSGTGLTVGSHSVTVTQASAGATATGSAVGASTVISAANNQLSVNVDGVASTYTIAAGTYTQSQLATAVQTASGGALNVSANGSNAL